MATREIPKQGNRNPDFSALNPQQRREIAGQGGHVEDVKDASYEFNSEAAHEGKLPQGSDKDAAFNPQEDHCRAHWRTKHSGHRPTRAKYGGTRQGR